MLTKEQLDKLNVTLSANADVLINKGIPKPKRKDAKVLINEYKEQFSIIFNYCYTNEIRYPHWIDDLITAASRMNNYSNKSLNRGSIIKILARLDEINTLSITWLLNVDERTAREYFSCIRAIYPNLSLYVNREIQSIERDNGALFTP